MPSAVASHVELTERPSYLAAAIASLGVLLLYLLTLAPTTSMWDTSEYMNAPEHGQVRGKEGVVAVKKRDHKPPAVSHA